MPMVSGSPRYQVVPSGQKRNGYQSVESAFIARTAVVSGPGDFRIFRIRFTAVTQRRTNDDAI